MVYDCRLFVTFGCVMNEGDMSILSCVRSWDDENDSNRNPKRTEHCKYFEVLRTDFCCVNARSSCPWDQWYCCGKGFFEPSWYWTSTEDQHANERAYESLWSTHSPLSKWRLYERSTRICPAFIELTPDFTGGSDASSDVHITFAEAWTVVGDFLSHLHEFIVGSRRLFSEHFYSRIRLFCYCLEEGWFDLSLQTVRALKALCRLSTKKRLGVPPFTFLFVYFGKSFHIQAKSGRVGEFHF